MREIVPVIISSLFGGALGAFFNYKGKAADANAFREDIYADHTEELFRRLDNLTKERDDLKAQNIELMSQVKQLKTQTRQLKEQVQSLTQQVKELTKVVEERKGLKQ